MVRIGVVLNRRASGNRRSKDRAQRFAELLKEEGWVRSPESFEELAEVVGEFRSRDIGVLAACGGDGTFFRTLTAMVHAYGGGPYPLFLPLRGGAMNTIARGVGCPIWKPERMLASVIGANPEGSLDITHRRLLRVNGESFGFMVGAGAIVNFVRVYCEGPRQGPLAAFVLLARLVASAVGGGAAVREVLRWVDAEVTCDGERVPFRSFSLIYASTIADAGLGFRPTYRAREKADHFHCLAGPVGAWDLLRSLGRIRRGRPTGLPQLFDHVARRLEVEFRTREPYMVDGDVFEPVERLTIEIGPELRIIRRAREE
jgi:diacylglycerol kinase family enzyme